MGFQNLRTCRLFKSSSGFHVNTMIEFCEEAISLSGQKTGLLDFVRRTMT
jgi:hypothetical protein